MRFSPVPSAPSVSPDTAARQLLWATGLALLLVLAWDASGLDMQVAAWFGTPTGFPLRSSHRFALWLHELPRGASWLLMLALWLAVPWPWGRWRELRRSERLQMAGSALLAVCVVALLKASSRTSCPWDQQAFGGSAHYVSHWAWGLRDGGPGRCFPAGHASAAFAYLSAYFVLRRKQPQRAWRWLVAVLLAGAVLGLAQQMRGAHYLSHTLWTAWICWTVGWLVDMLLRHRRRALQPT